MMLRVRVGNRNESRRMTGVYKFVRITQGSPSQYAQFEIYRRRYAGVESKETCWAADWNEELVGLDPEAREVIAAVRAELRLRTAA